MIKHLTKGEVKALNLIEVLQVKKDRQGYYKTLWGKKSFEGLVKTIEAILQIDLY
jgi:hypothetical protein